MTDILRMDRLNDMKIKYGQLYFTLSDGALEYLRQKFQVSLSHLILKWKQILFILTEKDNV